MIHSYVLGKQNVICTQLLSDIFAIIPAEGLEYFYPPNNQLLRQAQKRWSPIGISSMPMP